MPAHQVDRRVEHLAAGLLVAAPAGVRASYRLIGGRPGDARRGASYQERTPFHRASVPVETDDLDNIAIA